MWYVMFCCLAAMCCILSGRLQGIHFLRMCRSSGGNISFIHFYFFFLWKTSYFLLQLTYNAPFLLKAPGLCLADTVILLLFFFIGIDLLQYIFMFTAEKNLTSLPFGFHSSFQLHYIAHGALYTCTLCCFLHLP